MIAALIIVFREVFEAGLIIGIVLAVTRTVKHRNQWIAGGVLDRDDRVSPHVMSVVAILVAIALVLNYYLW